jgi:hypothetical protein
MTGLFFHSKENDPTAFLKKSSCQNSSVSTCNIFPDE